MLTKIKDVELVGSLWLAAWSFGVKLHGNDHAYRRGFGADSGHANSFVITNNFW